MRTPIYNFLKEYNNNGLRMHMPGHKGKISEDFLSNIFPYDITEILGADSLFDANGIIAESEKNAAYLFGTENTVYSAGGSTLCIQAMLMLMKQENRTVIAVRNAHKAFLNACILLDLEIYWIYPSYVNSIISGEISLQDIEISIKSTQGPCCVYITSPDYLGRIADINAISSVCRKYNVPLLVDNAHGAHLAFFPENQHPVTLGADLCCDSAHKMLPALTGSAYLHCTNKKYAAQLKSAMSFFGSTSPSYLILASLDLCNEYLEKSVRNDIKRCCDRINSLKYNLSNKYIFYGTEPFHITITGVNGISMAEKLREKGIECEYADYYCIVLLASPVCSDEEFNRLEQALIDLNPAKAQFNDNNFVFPKMKKVMTPRQAALTKSYEVDIENAEGKVCAEIKIPCPPAVPIVVSGEVINFECINILKRYGISKIKVL